MATLRSHTVIPAPVDAVWAVIADVANIADWFPAMRSSTGDGAARTVVLGDGATLEEEIVTLDPELRRLQYRVAGGDLPVTGHLGTVDVIALDERSTVTVHSTCARC